MTKLPSRCFLSRAAADPVEKSSAATGTAEGSTGIPIGTAAAEWPTPLPACSPRMASMVNGLHEGLGDEELSPSDSALSWLAVLTAPAAYV